MCCHHVFINDLILDLVVHYMGTITTIKLMYKVFFPIAELSHRF